MILYKSVCNIDRVKRYNNGRKNLILFFVYSSYEFCPSVQFRKPSEMFHWKTTVVREFGCSFRDTHSRNQRVAKSCLLIDSTANDGPRKQQATIATNHSCETLATSSITKTRGQANAQNLLSIPIVNPRVSHVMKHRLRCSRLSATAQCFRTLLQRFQSCITKIGKCSCGRWIYSPLLHNRCFKLKQKIGNIEKAAKINSLGSVLRYCERIYKYLLS